MTFPDLETRLRTCPLAIQRVGGSSTGLSSEHFLTLSLSPTARVAARLELHLADGEASSYAIHYDGILWSHCAFDATTVPEWSLPQDWEDMEMLTQHRGQLDRPVEEAFCKRRDETVEKIIEAHKRAPHSAPEDAAV